MTGNNGSVTLVRVSFTLSAMTVLPPVVVSQARLRQASIKACLPRNGSRQFFARQALTKQAASIACARVPQESRHDRQRVPHWLREFRLFRFDRRCLCGVRPRAHSTS
jgi:hypothetical protein